jgi:hypothetical protein
VEDRTPLLNAPIVSASENDALVDEHSSDGNATLGNSLLSFFMAASKNRSIASVSRRTARLSQSFTSGG